MDPDRIVGTEIAGFAIESVLGHGAMGVLYVAQQRSPARKVALKLITPAFADDETFRRRFLREATAGAAIEHPHILPVYAADEADGVLFLAMRLVDGRDLGAILRGTEALPVDRAERIVGQVGEALDAAHARGLVHRDVKPANILVIERSSEDGGDFCYLTDFGVSTWTASAAATTLSTGQAIGTANYMAPEQIQGEAEDGRADLYSLGCVLYECLTGRAPFGGRSPAEIMHAHLHERARPPSSLRPELTPAVDAVLDRALRKSPEERYASGRALNQELRSALAAPSTAPTADAPGRPRHRRARNAVAAFVLTLAFVAGALLIVDRITGTSARSPSPSSPNEPQLIRTGVSAVASQTAPSSQDAAGNPVTYVAANTLDGSLETAWRAPGDGRGVTITLVLDNPVNVDRIGLIPGYAKTDAQTGVNRFFQNRIITAVAYEVPGLPDTTKRFRPVPVPQFVDLDALTSEITVRILGTSAPHGADFTAISEIYIYGTPS